LSRRRREILELICLGSPAKIIAHELEITVNTVNSHIADICRKAQVSRSQLVVYALQHPAALIRGRDCLPGLHPKGCACDSPFCKGMRSAA